MLEIIDTGLAETNNGRSICRAEFCIPEMLRGRPSIKCDYRFNLRDRTGGRQHDTDSHLREWTPAQSKI